MLKDVEDMGTNSAPKVLGFIPNMVDNRRKDETLALADIKESIPGLNGEKIFDPFANKVQFVKALTKGKSLFHFKGKDFVELQGRFKKMATHIEENL